MTEYADHFKIGNTLYYFNAQQVNGHTVESNVPANAMFARYGTSSTAASTTAKTASISGFSISQGALVAIKFSYSNTASNPTLNVNSTGAKYIKRYGTTAVGTDEATSWKPGEVVILIYDGTYWQIVGRDEQVEEEDYTDTAGYHNSVYRGNYIGASYTSTQKTAVSTGTFEDMFIGDYWTINGVNWRIAAFDYWMAKGSVATSYCSTHHVVIVPDTALVTNAKMNKTDITTGAYVGSDFYKGTNNNTARATCITAIENAFGSASILAHNTVLCNTIDENGKDASSSVYTSKVELMNSSMLGGGTLEHGATENLGQLPLFFLAPQHIAIAGNANGYWLRNSFSLTDFEAITTGGFITSYEASYQGGARPVFAIK